MAPFRRREPAGSCEAGPETLWEWIPESETERRARQVDARARGRGWLPISSLEGRTAPVGWKTGDRTGEKGWHHGSRPLRTGAFLRAAETMRFAEIRGGRNR